MGPVPAGRGVVYFERDLIILGGVRNFLSGAYAFSMGPVNAGRGMVYSGRDLFIL